MIESNSVTSLHSFTSELTRCDPRVYISRRITSRVQRCADGTPCPPMRMLIEKERCAETPCHTYYWDAGPWQECQPSSAAAGLQSSCADGSRCRNADTHYCGLGTHHRDVVCRKSSGDKLPAKRSDSPFSIHPVSVSRSLYVEKVTAT